MAALTNNYRTAEKAGDVIAYNAGAGKTIWQGALVAADQGTGLMEPATDATGKTFIGVAFDPCDNSTGGAAANSGRIQKTGTFVYTLSGTTVSQAVVGHAVYAVDDNTVALSTTNSVLVGYVVGIVGTSMVRVRIDRAVG